jgi:DNA-binding NtrC family response regulator
MKMKDVHICVLVIDDDSDYYSFLKEKIDDANVEILYANGKDEIRKYADRHIDIFVVDNYFNGKPMGIKIIDDITSNDLFSGESIYVASGFGDYKLLKELINKNIAGFIDKNDITCSAIVDEIRNLKKLKESINGLSMKIDSL